MKQNDQNPEFVVAANQYLFGQQISEDIMPTKFLVARHPRNGFALVVGECRVASEIEIRSIQAMGVLPGVTDVKSNSNNNAVFKRSTESNAHGA